MQGIALNRHFQRIPAEPADGEAKVEPLRRPTAIPAISNRELRDIVLAILLTMAHARLRQEQLDAEMEGTNKVRPAAFAGALMALAAMRRQRTPTAAMAVR